MFYKRLVFSIICDNCGSKDKAMFKEGESIEILKILGLITNLEQVQMNIYNYLK